MYKIEEKNRPNTGRKQPKNITPIEPELCFCKDKIFSLPRQERRVYSLLSDGVPRSVADISRDLKLSDPRGIIRDLRKRGYCIYDVWVKSEFGNRFKRYFIKYRNNDK